MESLPTLAICLVLLLAVIAILWMMFHGRRFVEDSVVKELEESDRRQRDALERMDNAAKWKMAMVHGMSVPLIGLFFGVGLNRRWMEFSNWSDVGRFLLTGLVGYGASVLIYRALLGKGGKAKSRSDYEA